MDEMKLDKLLSSNKLLLDSMDEELNNILTKYGERSNAFKKVSERLSFMRLFHDTVIDHVSAYRHAIKISKVNNDSFKALEVAFMSDISLDKACTLLGISKSGV